MVTLRTLRLVCAALLIATLTGVVSGCRSTPKPPPKPPTMKVFRQIHQAGGTHYKALHHRGVVYYAFNDSLLITEANQTSPLRSVDLTSTRTTTPTSIGGGPAIDLLIDRADPPHLYVVIEDDEVLRFSLALPRNPELRDRWGASALGIKPRRLSAVGNEVFASGPGGVVRLTDQQRIFSSTEDVSRVARGDAGLIACVARRILRLSDGSYIGSATDLHNVQLTGSGKESTVFVRQTSAGAHVGLLRPDGREVDATRATVAVPGVVTAVRVLGDQLWISSDERMMRYTIQNDQLVEPLLQDILGVLDLEPIDASQTVICGTFGRMMYRADAPPQEQFTQVYREAGRLSMAMTDGQYILAGSREGLWMYLINARVEMTSRQFPSQPPAPATTAATTAGQAHVTENGAALIIKSSQAGTPAFEWREDANVRLRSIASIEGDLWLGHDRGITVLRSSATAPDQRSKGEPPAKWSVAARLRCAGPVLYIYPLLVGGGATFVSEFGGFGVARFVEVPITEPR